MSAAVAACAGSAATAMAAGHVVGEKGKAVAGNVLGLGRGLFAWTGVVLGRWLAECHIAIGSHGCLGGEMFWFDDWLALKEKKDMTKRYEE